jgi:peptidoglycan hydrolase-like protein with peptidoglycan-binding domain
MVVLPVSVSWLEEHWQTLQARRRAEETRWQEEAARQQAEEQRLAEQRQQEEAARQQAEEQRWQEEAARQQAEEQRLAEQRQQEEARKQLQQAQQKLRELGLYPGPIDGMLGPRTLAALYGYQDARGLPNTGLLDEATWKALEEQQTTEAVAAALRSVLTWPPRDDERHQLEDALCQYIRNTNNCARVIEKAQIPKFKERVSRDGDRLEIFTDSKEKRVFINEDGGNYSNTISYTFREYIHDVKCFIIDIHYYEGGAYLLVNSLTNKAIRIPEIPIFSPDKKRFLIAAIAGSYTRAALQVGRFTSQGFELEFAYEAEHGIDRAKYLWGKRSSEPKAWEPRKAKWINNTTFSFQKVELGGQKETSVTAKYENNRWTLEGMEKD